MSGMTHSKKEILCIACLLLIFNLMSLGIMKKSEDRTPSPGDIQTSPVRPCCMLLFLIDFDDFMCSSCLDSFLHLSLSLPQPRRDEVSMGILVYDGEKAQRKPEAGIKILEKKLRGFTGANQIGFPFWIDHSGIFKEITKEGSSAVLFNPKRGIIRKYVFPLSRKQENEILRILME